MLPPPSQRRRHRRSAPRSAAAEAFAEIEGELDPAEYEAFARHWVGAPEAGLAAARAELARAWREVDKSDPEALAAFPRAADFPALSSAADAALAAAQAAADDARRRAWEAEREARRRWRAAIVDLGAAEDGGFQERLSDGGMGPEMVLLPPGSFMMGSPEDEPERFGLGRAATSGSDRSALRSWQISRHLRGL